MSQESAKTILIIEDDATTRNLYVRGLEAEGFHIIDAENGLVGIQKAQTYLPDLVVCDIVMPDMDGYSVLHQMRQDPLTAIIPFIFLTGSDHKLDVRKGMELGADDYLTKPSTLEQLLKAIAIRLERQFLLRCCYGNQSHQFTESLPPATTSSVTAESIFPAIPQLKEVFDYIEANYHRGITLSNVAEAVGYSPAYLTSRVKKKTDQTVNGWIVKRRMAAARPLLRDSDQTIEQIAIKLGYQNACHFSRQFRQHHGIPPKIWRNQNQRSQVFSHEKPQVINTTHPQSEKYALLGRG
ncbi:response regulator transcription factor [Nodularia sp. NIES-3585]|uniref:response regulator transcription factor n=1 Tax=Nodularia sp. NIES-3585 TaxID=1973477 RepID=UPI000B5CE5C3|nr:response regulator [Nodularia sp. NIES-3585]GAX34825.1 two component transcriptional regulator, AraC family protein [Nodularia sp. NIES-3585]